MVTEQKMKEIEQSDEVRLYRLRKGTRMWKENARIYGTLLVVMGVAFAAIMLASAWAVHLYPPDSTDHYVKTGELNKTSAKIVDKISGSQLDAQMVFPLLLVGMGFAVGGVMLIGSAPDKKDIRIFDDALELYVTGKCKDNHPKFCPECGKNLTSKE